MKLNNYDYTKVIKIKDKKYMVHMIKNCREQFMTYYILSDYFNIDRDLVNQIRLENKAKSFRDYVCFSSEGKAKKFVKNFIMPIWVKHYLLNSIGGIKNA